MIAFALCLFVALTCGLVSVFAGCRQPDPAPAADHDHPGVERGAK